MSTPTRVLGKPGKPVRVLSFCGGAYDTAMQLGVTHAFLVSGLDPPDAVVGVSAGAINAVALAEILQAPHESNEVSPAQVSKFREILNTYFTLPRDMASALLPDIYQVDAERPLKAAHLPLQDGRERDEREKAIRAKAGLIDIANDVLGLRLSVRTLTLFVRTWLGWNAARSRGGWRSVAGSAVAALRGWALLGGCLLKVAPLFARLFAAIAQMAIPRFWRKGGDGYFGRGAWFRSGLAAGRLLDPTWRLLRRARSDAWLLLSAAAAFLLWSIPLMLLAAAGLAIWGGTQFIRVGAVAVGIGIVGAALIAIRFGVGNCRDAALQALFKHYGIANGVFDPHFLRSLFVRLFDPEYYGRLDLQTIVAQELARQPPATRDGTPAVLSRYGVGNPPIDVGIAAVRVDNGIVEILPQSTGVVQALMTAVAIPPLFEAQQIGGTWYVDGSLVSNEPISALIDRIKRPGATHVPVDPRATAVHVYAVSPLPLARELSGAARPYDDLIEIALRSLQLEELRDQTLERRMTQLYSRWLDPAQGATQKIPTAGRNRTLVRAWVLPIEPDEPLELNRRLPLAEDDKESKRLILEAVADGCRAALEAFNPERLKRMAPGGGVDCRDLIRDLKVVGPMPGSKHGSGPGLAEVCSRCCLGRGTEKPQPTRLRVKVEKRGVAKRGVEKPGPGDWPKEGVPGDVLPGDPAPVPLVVPSYERVLSDDLEAFKDRAAGAWPLERNQQAGSERATVSLLFAGGVFRGVYLLGVLNALNELRAKPDIVAGSSVGTITAAMAATVLSDPDDDNRTRALISLAGTFMTLDRLILTDRFADFVGGFTLRAGDTQFSLRQLDHTFRAYDRGDKLGFEQEARLVLAGLERLFYLSPFDAMELMRAVRQGGRREALTLLGRLAQEWLTRSGAGQQVLGAEPLRTLIEHHVFRPLQERIKGRPGHVRVDQRSLPIHSFLDEGILFLATATNVSKGSLEYLGLNPMPGDRREAMLVESLLASSAFPAVFRPRNAWEVMPRSESADKYLDGGVMDNLPLDAVALVLNHLSQGRAVVARQPKSGPHLMFTASLEAESPRRKAEQVVENWLRVWNRSKEFRYNRKIEGYANMQRTLQELSEHTQAAKTPVNLKVVSVVPKWLCGTFEFHPMLGFRRERQAASIAHGCATTLDAFHRIKETPAEANWLPAWNLRLEGVGAANKPADRNGGLVPHRPKQKGNCWFRNEVPCPFYNDRRDPKKPLENHVALIYDLCGKPKTHTHQGGEI